MSTLEERKRIALERLRASQARQPGAVAGGQPARAGGTLPLGPASGGRDSAQSVASGPAAARPGSLMELFSYQPPQARPPAAPGPTLGLPPGASSAPTSMSTSTPLLAHASGPSGAVGPSGFRPGPMSAATAVASAPHAAPTAPPNTAEISLVNTGKSFLVTFASYSVSGNQVVTSLGGINKPPRQWSLPNQVYFECVSKLRKIPGMTVHQPPELTLTSYGLITNRAHPHGGQHNPQQDKDYKPDGESLSLTSLGIPAALAEALYPFQRDSVQYARLHHGRVLIADEMGLGKTIQALAIACLYQTEWPLLIVTGASIRGSWFNEVLKWLSPACVSPDLVKLVDPKFGKIDFSHHRVLIVSYALLTNHLEKALQAPRLGVVIIDESHLIKNNNAKRTRAILNLASRASRCILLSGTPSESGPWELFSQLQALHPHIGRSQQLFLDRYCIPHKAYMGKVSYRGVRHGDELSGLLRRLGLIRRFKSHILHELPPKTRHKIFVDCSSLTAEELDRLLESDSTRSSSKSAGKPPPRSSSDELSPEQMRLWRETAFRKLDGMKRHMTRLFQQSEPSFKLVLFAFQIKILAAFKIHTSEVLGLDYIHIDGATPNDRRTEYVNRFQHDPNCRVALLSITAANAGITLHASSHVAFAELYWNPGVLLQAEDRCHRIGQTRPVRVEYWLGSGSFDDQLWVKVNRKLQMLSKTGVGLSDGQTQLQVDGTRHSAQRQLRSGRSPPRAPGSGAHSKSSSDVMMTFLSSTKASRDSETEPGLVGTRHEEDSPADGPGLPFVHRAGSLIQQTYQADGDFQSQPMHGPIRSLEAASRTGSCAVLEGLVRQLDGLEAELESAFAEDSPSGTPCDGSPDAGIDRRPADLDEARVHKKPRASD
ncbi:hypothetical protein H696_01719 [Fonticula alba]|uniref:SWI/SNF-related matrix-associated actin-dependent regulator of chromatin subfamily A-like protein 1 n=1 Tax=Fonticula alba TaxID=691883 RepID=A0A058ZD61_FONAL|nr:hypothetical protein H696_01719 [Fonticula alba]KCV72324.1 hypothetical protein H696_01719 [Fonticula alba]|eukprot:XP_009493902.1 hypothetical protein H696_01719 [Fonticula alba]